MKGATCLVIDGLVCAASTDRYSQISKPRPELRQPYHFWSALPDRKLHGINLVSTVLEYYGDSWDTGRMG